MTDNIVEVVSEDAIAASIEDIPAPQGRTQGGDYRALEDAELVTLEQLSDEETLMIWKYQTRLELNISRSGFYYLYSNPFVFRKAS